MKTFSPQKAEAIFPEGVLKCNNIDFFLFVAQSRVLRDIRSRGFPLKSNRNNRPPNKTGQMFNPRKAKRRGTNCSDILSCVVFTFQIL